MTTLQSPSRFYTWILGKSRSPHAVKFLACLSFAESSFSPIPPDIMLIPMVLTARSRAWTFALICTLASVLGGILGYFIGYWLYESIGMWIIESYALEAHMVEFQTLFQSYGFWFILLKGVTPIPYKLVTIASGVTQLDLLLFMLASIISRSARFFLISALIHFFGERAQKFMEKHFTLFMLVTFAILLVGIYGIQWIFT